MGKRIIVRRRGRGGIFKAPTHRRVSKVCYPSIEQKEDKIIGACVKRFLHDPGRGVPIALISIENGEEFYIAAPEGLTLNQNLSLGECPVEIGNILPLSKIPEGTIICNIEHVPGDGGKIARSSGTYATLVAHTPKGTEVKLPSKRSLYLNDRCMAMIGLIAGGGRTEKPFLKAGAKRFLMRSRGIRWPNVTGVSMVSASHPHGGGRHKHEGKPTSVSRDTPPGRKVGLIAARQSGRASQRRGKRGLRK